MFSKAYLSAAAFAAFLAASTTPTQAYTIHFQNNCRYTVWPAVGAAPNGQPNQSIKYGARLDPRQASSFGVDDKALGVRAWGRTGCDGSGANCQTGACNGGLVCNDAGITSHALLSEYGYGSGNRVYWDLSFVGGSINVPARLTGPDGQRVQCVQGNCPPDQAFNGPNDFQATRNSAPGGIYTHTFCP